MEIITMELTSNWNFNFSMRSIDTVRVPFRNSTFGDERNNEMALTATPLEMIPEFLITSNDFCKITISPQNFNFI